MMQITSMSPIHYTIASGQYGYLDYLEPGTVDYLFDEISLVDTDGDGVWIVAHAVVCM
jgi:hypothetical protein